MKISKEPSQKKSYCPPLRVDDDYYSFTWHHGDHYVGCDCGGDVNQTAGHHRRVRLYVIIVILYGK